MPRCPPCHCRGALGSTDTTHDAYGRSIPRPTTKAQVLKQLHKDLEQACAALYGDGLDYDEMYEMVRDALANAGRG